MRMRKKEWAIKLVRNVQDLDEAWHLKNKKMGAKSKVVSR